MAAIYAHLHSFRNLHFIYFYLHTYPTRQVLSFIPTWQMRKLNLRKADHTRLSASRPWAGALFPPHNSGALSWEFQARAVTASSAGPLARAGGGGGGVRGGWGWGRGGRRGRHRKTELSMSWAQNFYFTLDWPWGRSTIRTQLKAQRPLCHCFNEKPITKSLVGGGEEELGTGVGGRRMLLVSGWFTAAVPDCLEGRSRVAAAGESYCS